MKRRLLSILYLILVSGFSMAANQQIIYGYVEKAILTDNDMVLSAKLDTGAKSASLNAIHIQQFEKNDKTFLRFTVPGKEGDKEFVAEYLGKVRIKVRAGETSLVGYKPEPIKRPIVMMKIKIGEKIRDIKVNLTNRKRFNYPLLLGRDAIIAFDGIVDPSQTFTTTRLIKDKK